MPWFLNNIIHTYFFLYEVQASSGVLQPCTSYHFISRLLVVIGRIGRFYKCHCWHMQEVFLAVSIYNTPGCFIYCIFVLAGQFANIFSWWYWQNVNCQRFAATFLRLHPNIFAVHCFKPKTPFPRARNALNAKSLQIHAEHEVSNHKTTF